MQSEILLSNKVKVINVMRYMSVYICNTHVLISDDNIKYIKQYLE